MATVVVALAVGVVAAIGIVYRDQIRRRLTHLEGGPRHTVAWQPVTGREGALVHLAVAGDVGGRGRRIRETGRAVARVDDVHPLDGLVLLGDNVYPSGDPARLGGTVFGPFAGVLDHVPLFAVLGNHDVRRGHAAGQMAALGMPGRWWAQGFGGDLLLVGLDSALVGDRAQRDWLAATLAGATQPWRIVAVHHSPFSAGYQESHLAARRAFVPLFERYGVQLVLSGHDHDYQRSVPVGGVTYVVSGGCRRHPPHGPRRLHGGVVLVAPLRRARGVPGPARRPGREPRTQGCRRGRHRARGPRTHVVRCAAARRTPG